MKFLRTVLVLVAGMALGQAQPVDRETLWKEVAEAEKKGRPKTAVAKLQTMLPALLSLTSVAGVPAGAWHARQLSLSKQGRTEFTSCPLKVIKMIGLPQST